MSKRSSIIAVTDSPSKRVKTEYAPVSVVNNYLRSGLTAWIRDALTHDDAMFRTNFIYKADDKSCLLKFSLERRTVIITFGILRGENFQEKIDSFFPEYLANIDDNHDFFKDLFSDYEKPVELILCFKSFISKDRGTNIVFCDTPKYIAPLGMCAVTTKRDGILFYAGDIKFSVNICYTDTGAITFSKNLRFHHMIDLQELAFVFSEMEETRNYCKGTLDSVLVGDKSQVVRDFSLQLSDLTFVAKAELKLTFQYKRA